MNTKVKAGSANVSAGKSEKAEARSVIFAGVDDGHYSTKIVTEGGGMFSIPSRAKLGRHLINWKDDNDADSIFFNAMPEDVSYTVDSKLQTFDDTRFNEFPKSPLNRVLVHAGLLEAGLGGQDVSIVTGLPVDYYYLANGHRNDALIEAKVSNLSKVVTCGHKPMANIVRNLVATEAIAAYFDQLMDMDGQPTDFYHLSGDQMVGVIDVGGKTTDCAVVLAGGEQVDPNRSGSNNVGLLRLNDLIGSRLQTLFDLDNVSQQMIDSAILSGTLKVAGELHDVSEMVNLEKERLAEQIMAGVQTKIGSGKDLDSILFVGGGSIVLRKQLERHFAHHHFPERPEFANARGMFKIAKYVFGEG